MLMNKSLADYYMERYDLDALIVTQPVNVQYFSGYTCVLTDNAQEWNSVPGGSNIVGADLFILPHKGEPVLLVPSVLTPFGVSTYTEDVRAFGGNPPVTDLKDIPAGRPGFDDLDRALINVHSEHRYSTLPEAVDRILTEKGLHQSRIGFELQGFSESVFRTVSNTLSGCSFADCSELVRLIRMIKTEEEISLLKRSAEINELAIQAAAREIAENRTFGDVLEKFNTTAQGNGAVPQHCIFSSNGLGVGVNEDYMFKSGHCVLLDSGVYYRDYISDTGTTAMVGTVDRKLVEIFKHLHEALQVGLGQVKPGQRCSAINDTMVKYLARKGISVSDTHGHGIGLQPSEYPIIASGRLDYSYNNGFEEQSADFRLEKNMVICLEVPVYLFGEASYIVEKSAIVTGTGYNAITKQERSAPILNAG